MSLVSWLSLASLAQSVSTWSSLSRLLVSSFTARKVFPARPDRDSRNTKAATGDSWEVSSLNYVKVSLQSLTPVISIGFYLQRLPGRILL